MYKQGVPGGIARFRESVPYVKVYRYNPKHLYPKLNGYGDNGQRKVRSSCGSTYCTFSADALLVEQKWNVMAHWNARVEKWRGKRRMEGVASSRALYRSTVYPALLPLMRTPRLPAAEWTDTLADINGLVRFAGKPNLVSARVPSRSISALHCACPWDWNGVNMVPACPCKVLGTLRTTAALMRVIM